MSSFITLFSEISCYFRIIECIRVQWNHPDLSGYTLGWGAGWAVTRKQGTLLQAYLTPGVTIQTVPPYRGPEYADQAVTEHEN